MVTYPRTPPAPPAPRRLAVALVLVVCCCALALACLSTAAALPGRPQLTAGVAADRTPAGGRQGSGTGEQQSSGREPRGREQPASGQEQPAADGEQPASGQVQPSSGGGEQQSSGNRAQAGSGGDQSSSGSRARRDATRGEQQQGTGRGEPQDSGRDQSSSGGGARRDATRGEQQGGSGRGERGGAGRGSGGGNRGQQAPASASGTAPAAPAAASPTATPALAPSTPSTTTTATAAPPVAVSPPQVAGAPPAVTRRLPQAPARRAPGRHGTQHARPALARATSRGLAPAAVSAGAAALGKTVPDASTRARRARGAGPRHRPHSRSSPLVTTITTIVDVVPVPLRALLGVLFVLAVALGLRSRVVALRARRLERQRAQLLEDVGLLQAALLPVPPARLGPVGTSAAYRPADGPGAGGDFYDVFALADGRLAVIVGDISGHGRQALPHTALVRFTLRAYLEAGLSPRSAVQTAGAVLERQLGDSFATVVAATYQPRDRVLVYACAGHPPPIVLGAQSLAPVTLCSSPPIGVGMRTGTRQTTVSLPGSGQVCFHTDGVTDARVGPELFGELRLARTLAQLASEGSGATASALLGRVAAETDARPDDMAACLLCVEGGADAPPTVLVEELELDREAAAAGRTEQFLLACGVPAGEIPELVCSARAAAGRSGTALLELRLDDGQPVVSLQRDNVTPLEAPRALRRAGLGVSR
jgi:serine phosphatase RsbU (regulator of sigma subunit)